jgi:hypothetical protein
MLNVSTFLFADFSIEIIPTLNHEFRKLNFELVNGNTADFELPDDQKIVAYLKGRGAGQFHYQLCDTVRDVWSRHFLYGRMEPGSFDNSGTSFTYMTCNDDHCLRIQGEKLESGRYRITIECADKNPSSPCSIS